MRDLGGGRMTKDSALNYEVGVEVLAKPGTVIRKGELLARVHAASAEAGKAAVVRIAKAFELSSRAKSVPGQVAATIY